MLKATADRHQVIATLRKACKQCMDIRYGFSSKPMEALVRSHAMQIAKYLQPDEKLEVAAGSLPDWLTPALIANQCKGTALPDGVAWPALPLTASRSSRCPFCAGFECYMFAHSVELKEKAGKNRS